MSQRKETPTRAVMAATAMMRNLDPGPLAELRRMDASTGAPAFWRLAAQHPNTIGGRKTQERWIEIIRIVAILTPKGDPATRPPLHDPNRRLGTVLCDGGSPSWPGGGQPRPAFSERRLAQLMAARGPQRAILLERAARMLAGSREPGSGVDVVDIAWILLKPDNGQRLAEPYYRRLDRAERAGEEGTT